MPINETRDETAAILDRAADLADDATAMGATLVEGTVQAATATARGTVHIPTSAIRGIGTMLEEKFGIEAASGITKAADLADDATDYGADLLETGAAAAAGTAKGVVSMTSGMARFLAGKLRSGD